MQWIPFPDSYMGPQILTVTCKRDINYLTSDSTPTSSVIQLWSFEDSSKGEVISHLYSIAIDNGPIWDMKFCPSGGYNDTDRLGLLACTSLSHKIYIYALPLPDNVKKDSDEVLMLKLDASLILDSGITDRSAFSCKLSWSRYKNHSLLAAGFSNGFVSLWNLDLRSSLLSKRTSEGSLLLPFNTFVAHQEAITCLVLHRSSNADYLLTGSKDRRLRVFQLNDDTPSVEIFCLKCPSRVSAAEWPANWIAFFYSCDSEYTFQRSELKLKNPNELGPIMDYGSLSNITSSITDVAVNEWTDNIYFGSIAGDVLGCYRANYLLTSGSEKSIRRYVSFSFFRFRKKKITILHFVGLQLHSVLQDSKWLQ